MYKVKIIQRMSFLAFALLFLRAGYIYAQPEKSTENYNSVTEYYPFSASLISERQTLYPIESFGLRWFPDMPVMVIHERPGYPFRMFVANASTYLFEGDSIQAVTNVQKVLSPGDPDAFDNGYAGIGGVYYHTDGKMYAFYHAEDHKDLDFPDGTSGYYACAGLAISEDNGLSFAKAGPVITCQKDKDWESFPNQPVRGLGVPCCIKSKDGKYLYVYYADASNVDGRGSQIFMARADISSDPPLPGSFYKYYNGSFSEPGIGGLDSPVITAIDKNLSNAGAPFVIYSDYLDKYIMLYSNYDWVAQGNNEIGYSGFYIAYSEDGINWFNRDKLLEGRIVPIFGETLDCWRPAIIWDDTNEQTGLFVYAYSDSWGLGEGLTPHYMVSRKIKFEKYSSVIFEAEDGLISSGSVDTEYPGYTGTGFVNLTNQTGTYLELTLSITVTGEYDLSFHFANGNAENRPCEILLDGTVLYEEFDFPSTSDWANWQYSESISLDLTAGDHSLRITGITSNSAPNIDHLKLISYDTNTVSYNKTDDSFPQFALNQNYPNPFNPKTIISYQLSAAGEVDLSIYNAFGQKVITLVSEKQVAGSYKAEWDATGFAGGFYLYRLEIDKRVINTKKLLYNK